MVFGVKLFSISTFLFSLLFLKVMNICGNDTNEKFCVFFDSNLPKVV